MSKRQHRVKASSARSVSARRAQGRLLRLEQLEDRRLLTVLYRINAGGPQLAGTPVWAADTAAAPSSFSNASTGGNSGTNTTTATINMSDPSIPAGTPTALFQTERFDKAGGANLLWSFPVTPGPYQVRLYFAETFSGNFAVGARVFDVAIEGATVLSHYDMFADVGSLKGVVKSFIVSSDANLNIDFLRVTQNPTVKGIEILTAPAPASPLVPSATTLDFGNVLIGQTGTKQLTLTNGGQIGDPSITINPTAASLAPSGTPFTFSFTQSTPIILAPGQSTIVTVNFIPSAASATSADLTIPNNGVSSPLAIHLMGTGVTQPPTILYRIDAGGPQLAGTPVWAADTTAAPSSFSNASTTGNSATNSTTATIDVSDPSIPAGTPMALFQTERFDKPAGTNLLWDFPVTPGPYLVRLYFAETVSALFANGARVFDVAIEGLTLLSHYDVFADVGSLKGVVKSYIVTSDADLNIDFLRVTQNPSVKGIEILRAPSTLQSSAASLNFGNVNVGQTATQQVTLTNGGQTGDPNITINPTAASLSPSGTPFTFSFTQSTPIILSPGQSTIVTVNYTPTSGSSDSATLQIPNSGPNSPLGISLTGTGATQTTINFGKSTLNGTTGLAQPTSLQFGPDGRLYVAQQNGLIRAYTIVRNAANSYTVSATENITQIQQIPNHDDDGTLDPNVNTRLVTGLFVTGTAQNPVLYVSSSDPRIGGGNAGTDTNLDTNSGIISRLTWTGSAWQKLDLVRGLPRSEENHASNGLQLDPTTNTLYLALGGNTNMGAPSNNFAFLPEYALSSAILSINLNAIGNTTYDLPTLDDENRSGVIDANDPFGGDNGKNQARIVSGGPVQVYAPGFRNPYDLVITSQGRMYAVDNGPNAGWGDVPIGEGPGGNATNQVNEPGVSYNDSLHFITGAGYYAGHPNPTRSNPNNTFNTTNPQSPVTVGNPIESDFLVPGPENHALALFGDSTDGITEYTASTFGGAMQGNLLIASFDNTIKRIVLNAAGNQVVSNTSLFSNVGLKPLDVTSPATGPFAGSVWVADIALGKIIVFEPVAAGGGNPNDFDGDGYSNADESANGTDPNNAADVPPDYDHDFTSNLLDPNDDNDSLPDTSDPYAVDPANGANTPVGTLYDWKNTGQNLGGLLNMGFTGLMTNGVSNYESLYNPQALTAGGAASVFTIDSATAGTALGATNTQQQAFQFGVNVANQATPFTAQSTVLGAFNGVIPQAGQQMGFYIGTGDQDNFVQIVLAGDNGGTVKALREVGGVDTPIASQSLALPGPGSVNLRLTVDPFAKTVQPRYSVDGVNFVNLGSAISIPASWLTGTLAVGLISTNPAGTGLPVTWGSLGIVPEQQPGSGAARLEIFTMGSIDNSSTAHLDSFRIYNNSTGGRRIDSVTFDLTTSLLPDLVFDPVGTGGDVAGIDFTPDTGAATTGLADHAFSGSHSGGFDGLTVDFSDFDPGEVFTFHVDVDPLSVKGAAQPGPAGAASISGLEVSGATVTIHFSDGTILAGEPFALVKGASFFKVHSQQNFSVDPIDSAPQLSLVGVPTTPVILQSAAQTARVTGQVGASVRLLQTEVALELAGVPNGGFDVQPYDGNKVILVNEKTGVIGASGFIDIPITLTDSLPEAGLNYLTAVIDEPDGRTSNLSNIVKVALNGLPPGSPPVAASLTSLAPPLPGDYDHNDVVDAQDYAVWQQTFGQAGPGLDADGNGNGIVDSADYTVWRDNLGRSQSDPAPLAVAQSATVEFAVLPPFGGSEAAIPSAGALTTGTSETVIGIGIRSASVDVRSLSAVAPLPTDPSHTHPQVVSTTRSHIGDPQLTAVELLFAETQSWRPGHSDHYTANRFGSSDATLSDILDPDALAWEQAFESLAVRSEVPKSI